MVDDALRVVLDRAPALDVLTSGPTTRRALAAELGVSRSTVDRTVRELSTHGLATREGERVEATTAGHLAVEALDGLRDDFRDALAVRPLFAHLPPDAPIDDRLLAGATVREVTPPRPYGAADRLRDLFAAGGQVYGLSAALSDDRAPRTARDAVVDAGATYEVVYAADVAAFLRAERRGERREMARTGRYRAFVTDALPFGLFYRAETDDEDGDGGGDRGGDVRDADANEGATGPAPRVALAVYDDADLRGVVYNDTDAAVVWARETYERYRERARELAEGFATGPEPESES